MTTAFLFPGLDALRRDDDFQSLRALPEFAAHAETLGIGVDVEVRFARDAIVGTSLAIVALQTASAQALERRGVVAGFACGYSIGDVARSAHASCFSLAELAAFTRALPNELPFAEGSTVAATTQTAGDEVVRAIERLVELGLTVSRLSPRVLTFAGSRAAAERGTEELRARRWRARELIGCVLHAPAQRGLAAVLAHGLRTAPLRAPCRVLESAVSGRALASVEDLRDELAANARMPCDFAAAVERLRAVHGVTRFVDVGPGRSAQRLLRHFDPPIEAESALDLL